LNRKLESKDALAVLSFVPIHTESRFFRFDFLQRVSIRVQPRRTLTVRNSLVGDLLCHTGHAIVGQNRCGATSSETEQRAHTGDDRGAMPKMRHARSWILHRPIAERRRRANRVLRMSGVQAHLVCQQLSGPT
jgi:hypothetical protein